MKNRGNIHSDFREDGAPIGLQERLYGDEASENHSEQKLENANLNAELHPLANWKWPLSLLIIIFLLGLIFYSL